MSKRVIAFAAFVTKNSSEQNAFLSRAKKATSEVFQFSSGWDIINTLINDNGGAINDIRIHDHGFYGGIIGDGNNTGMYTESYHLSQGDASDLYKQATAGNFAYRVSLKIINLADSCSIVTYGCNCSAFAQELSLWLGQSNRGDILVTGADNNVYEKNGKAYVDRRTDGLSQGKRGRFRTYKAGSQVAESATWSYK